MEMLPTVHTGARETIVTVPADPTGPWGGLLFRMKGFRVQEGKRKCEAHFFYEDLSDEGPVSLEVDDIAIDRREDRNRLANAALVAAEGLELGPLPEELRKNQASLHSLFREVLDVAWAAWAEVHAAEMVGGSEFDTPPDWLVPNYLLRESGTIMFSGPGNGKSTFGLLMAQSMQHADDVTTNLFNATKANVLYLNLERSKQSMMDRLARVNTVLGLERTAQLPMINAKGKSLTAVYDIAMSAVEAMKIDVVMLDSLSRAGAGSMVKDDDANAIMDMLNAFPGWLAIAHTPHHDQMKVFGSQMLTAAADMEVALLSREFRAGVTSTILVPVKANDVPKASPRLWELRYQPEGLSEVRFLPNASPSVAQYLEEKDED